VSPTPKLQNILASRFSLLPAFMTTTKLIDVPEYRISEASLQDEQAMRMQRFPQVRNLYTMTCGEDVPK